MSSQSARRSFVRTAALSVAGTVVVATLAACGGGGSSSSGGGKYGFSEAKQSASAKITVWVDSDRTAATTAFKKANPNVPINVVTYDGSANGSNSFKTKIGLLDRAVVAGRTSSSRPRTTTRRGPARRPTASSPSPRY